MLLVTTISIRASILLDSQDSLDMLNRIALVTNIDMGIVPTTVNLYILATSIIPEYFSTYICFRCPHGFLGLVSSSLQMIPFNECNRSTASSALTSDAQMFAESLCYMVSTMMLIGRNCNQSKRSIIHLASPSYWAQQLDNVIRTHVSLVGFVCQKTS